MSALERLCELLDSRFVRYRSDNGEVTFMRSGKRFVVSDDRGGYLRVDVRYATPEYVVDMAMPLLRCHARHDVDHDTLDLDRYACEDCGAVWWMADAPTCYCPRCGARLEVDE